MTYHYFEHVKRAWCMPDKQTFKMWPVRKFIKYWMHEGLWIDPFAGKNSPAHVTNDLNPNAPTRYHMDALTFLKEQDSQTFDGAFLDWPYSNGQYRECYLEAGMPVDSQVFNAHYQASIKSEISRILKPSGRALVFGWNSNGIGKNRGFYLVDMLVIAHGRMHNDTICTVELKSGSRLDDRYGMLPKERQTP